MSVKYKLNPKYANEFKEFLLDIKDNFLKNDQSIHNARNQLKVIPFNGVETVVKAFRIPNIINQFAYAYIRDSKAKKSFENAMKLVSKNVNTPEPIGYIEFHEKGLLKKSFFISLKQEYEFTLAHIRDEQPVYKDEVLNSFAKFTFEVHKKGILHSDYSGGNVLVKKENDTYAFSLVDINRMKFKIIENYKGLENFNKFWFNKEDLTTIAKSYAQVANLDMNKSIHEIIQYDRRLKEFVENRRKWKKRLLGK